MQPFIEDIFGFLNVYFLSKSRDISASHFQIARSSSYEAARPNLPVESRRFSPKPSDRGLFFHVRQTEKQILPVAVADLQRFEIEDTLQFPSLSFDLESLEVGHSDRKDLLLSLANMKEQTAITWFWRKWSGTLWPEDSDELLVVADELRAIWKCDAEISLDLLRKYLVQKPEDILNKWLRWRPSPEQVEVRKSKLLKETQERLPEAFNFLRRSTSTEGHFENVAIAFRCSLWSRSLVPEQRNLRSMLIQGVFEHWRHFRVAPIPTALPPISSRREKIRPFVMPKYAKPKSNGNMP